ncbi:DUF488 domain-containing protein [Pseudonocardia benzenivorans]|uniref:DUF488 family protein n=2 Tax=Pseudonocardia TaxID=1847 RepID=F4CVW6_PSEUX|nr:DUF488 family protein [Pseudonocardia dioxanivorans]AEA25451.1 protein of unknown function DUF488 [Pseudonocardia dioxanivorans CB1190]GJF06152.1 hypothetical protein PSD17_51000 [Pseudonocardia sp. D17]
MTPAELAWENEGGRLRRPAQVRTRRVYDPPTEHDGARVLVDRLWPRGLGRADARLDEWCRDVAPSTGLRRWYGHDPAKFAEFRRRYRAELTTGDQRRALRHLAEVAARGPVTLLTASKDLPTSQATVLAEVLADCGGAPG